MFFVLAKILGFFANLSNVLMMLGFLGVLLLRTRFARAGRRVMVASLVLIAVAGLSPLGNILLLPLEERFPPWDAARGDPDGIVVLGGAITPDVSAARGEPALNEAAERLTAAAMLARRYPRARIVYSGGSGTLFRREHTEADYAVRLLEGLGVARERMAAEDRSRDTAENAAFSKDVARPKPGERWLLVTSAYHMPRAIGAFRQARFTVEAYPVDWRTRGAAAVFEPFAMGGSGLQRTDTATREWIGLLVYRLTGRTADLYPGP